MQVTEEERSQAKQICYGMIYGIGSASLGEQLGVVEEEASVFMHDFKSTYPGVKRFMDRTLTECRKNGFVTTLSGRRRYLPQITGSANQYARAAAERQAINTTVQGELMLNVKSFLEPVWELRTFSGSAADLVKSAMNDIDRKLFEAFPKCRTPLRPSKQTERSNAHEASEGAYFLLQMHDELIYEVNLTVVMLPC